MAHTPPRDLRAPQCCVSHSLPSDTYLRPAPLPLHALISGAHAHDSTMLAALLDTNPGVRERRGRPGRPRRRPDKLHARLGIRLSALSPLPAPARHRGSDRPPRGRELLPPAAGALGRGTDHVVAAGLPTPGPALRPHRGHAVRAARSRLRLDLPPPAAIVVARHPIIGAV